MADYTSNARKHTPDLRPLASGRQVARVTAPPTLADLGIWYHQLLGARPSG